jgi:hypothetical protein
MELQGRMDENGQIWVTLTVRGTRSEATIEASVDTGFTHPLLASCHRCAFRLGVG